MFGGYHFDPWTIPNNFGCQCLAQLHLGWAETFRSKRTLKEGGGRFLEVRKTGFFLLVESDLSNNVQKSIFYCACGKQLVNLGEFRPSEPLFWEGGGLKGSLCAKVVF